MGTAKHFWNWMAERYSRQPIPDEASYEKKLAMTRDRLTFDMRAVEFGCGTGSTAILHAPHVKTYHAIDVSEKMIEIAKSKANEAGLSNMTFTTGTLEEASIPDTSCDAMLALNILPLVPDLDKTLRSVARIVVPGGYFFSSTICSKNLKGSPRRLALATRVLPLLPTVVSISVDELVQKIETTGFTIEERFEQSPGVVFIIAQRQNN